MGDKPSVTIASDALRKTADIKKDVYPNEVNIIKNLSHVDDIVDSVSSHAKAQNITENINIILKYGNFHIKNWTISKCPNEYSERSLLSSSHERVLGIPWIPESDKLMFNVRINFSKKKVSIGSQIYFLKIFQKRWP